jgi:hypothetical protein
MIAIALLAAMMCWAVGSLAQDQEGHDQAAMMEAWIKAATPGEPHAFLSSMAGTWKTQITHYEMGKTTESTEGEAVFEVLMGGRCVQGHYTGTMMGQPHQGMSLDGFNNVTGEFWSAWIDNMSTGLMNLNGKMMEDGKSVESWGEMATPMGGKMKMRFVSTLEADDKMSMKAYMMLPGSDEEHLTMEIAYTRIGS